MAKRLIEQTTAGIVLRGNRNFGQRGPYGPPGH